MSCNDIVRQSVQLVPGDGPESGSHCGESPSFFDRLTDYQLGGVAVFAGVHADHVYAFGFLPSGAVACTCYSCGVGRTYFLEGGE